MTPRQRAKALHVGTYEAAVHNMLRRMHDQADHGTQFYLYRVHLEPSVVAREGWLIDPSDFVGDVVLDEVCPPGVDVARYLNYHEDPGGFPWPWGGTRSPVYSKSQFRCPKTWVRESVAALDSSSDALVPADGRLSRYMRPSSPRAGLGLAGRLPINLRDQFASTARFDEGDDPAQWARRVSGLYAMIADPACLLSELDGKEHRHV